MPSSAPAAGTYYPNRISVNFYAPGTANIPAGSCTAITGFKPLTSMTNLAPADYFIEAVDTNGVLTGLWEIGVGQLNGATFERTTVTDNSSGTTALINFTSNVRISIGPSINLFKRNDYFQSTGNTYTARYNMIGGCTVSNGTKAWYPSLYSVLKSAYAQSIPAPVIDLGFVIKKNGVAVGTVTIPAGSIKSPSITLTDTLETTDYLTVDALAYAVTEITINIIYAQL